MANLNHQEILRLEGLVMALREKLNLYDEIVDEWIIAENRTTAEIEFSQRLYKTEEDIEFYSNPKNF